MAHGSRRRLERNLVLTLLGVVLLAGGTLTNAERADRPPPEAPRPTTEHRVSAAAHEVAPSPAEVAAANAVTGNVSGWASWTLRDRRTGRTLGDPRHDELSNTESVVKIWLAAEMLRAAAEEGREQPGDLRRSRVERMIRHSSDSVAEAVYERFGGDASIRRMIRECDLPDTELGDAGYWARTQMSSRDTVRMLECVLLSDRILPPAMREYLLAEMHRVDRQEAFGIQDAYPAGPGVRIAVKNGWTANSPTGNWNLNCTGVWGPERRWVLAVMTRYDIGRGQHYGERICTDVTRALFAR